MSVKNKNKHIGRIIGSHYLETVRVIKPIIILNTNGYDPLLDFFYKAIEEQFMRPEHAAMWSVADTPEEAVCFNVKAYHQMEKHVGSVRNR